MSIIEFNSVSKYYKSKKQNYIGIEDISFSIEKGSIVGLIGPNGAGKSTSVKLLSGILKPDSGNVTVMGKEPWKERKELSKSMGIMFGNRSSLWYNIPAIDSVYLMKDIYGIKDKIFKERLDKYTEILNLSSILNKPVRKLSLGQKIKIELLITLIHNPELLILDEPSIGLDIVAKQNLREILLELSRKEERTIILTTHDLPDIEKISNHIILINKGTKIMDLDNISFNQIISQYKILYLEKDSNLDISPYTKYLREETPQNYKFFLDKDNSDGFIKELVNTHGTDIQFRVENPNLEDIVYEKYSWLYENN